jgi:hypothetical protein
MPSSELVNTEMSEFYGDVFANLVGWDNAAGAWFVSGAAGVGVTATSGWLVCLTTPTDINQRLRLNLEMTGTTVLPDFKFALRSGYAGLALTDGYVVTYTFDGTNALWYLYRYNASVATSLATAVDVTADALKKVSDSAWREFEFKVEDLNPVHLVVMFNGYTLFDVYDFGASRITSVGSVGIFGGSS